MRHLLTLADLTTAEIERIFSITEHPRFGARRGEFRVFEIGRINAAGLQGSQHFRWPHLDELHRTHVAAQLRDEHRNDELIEPLGG